MGFGSRRPRSTTRTGRATRFADIAGYEGSKAEVMEVVDFLKHPDRYDRAGAVGPKGVLMVGPPGTGKTLLAERRRRGRRAVLRPERLELRRDVRRRRGVAGQGPLRRRPEAGPVDHLHRRDRRHGGRRGPAGFGSNDEREQTLNQLLSDMDGFEPGAGVVVMAATNRAEILDAALLRPGVRPDGGDPAAQPAWNGPRSWLSTARGKTARPDVDLDVVSRGTPGFSGADLANLVNEAAINAVRADRGVLTRGRLRRREGPAPASAAATRRTRCCREEKHAVAVHEAGHALVAALSDARRSGREGHDPSPRCRARRDRAAARVRAAPLPREPPDRLARRAPRRPGRGVHRPRRSRRPARRATSRARPSSRRHGAGVGVLRGGRAHRLRAGGTEPRQPLRRPALRRGDPALHRPGGGQAAAGGRGHGYQRCCAGTATPSTGSSALLLERETIDGADLAAIVGTPGPADYQPAGAPLALAMRWHRSG